MPIKKMERRYINTPELRLKDDGKVLTGYAARFNVWSVDLWGFKERIRPGAFKKTIGEADVRALFNHNPDLILGRNKNDTLELWEDDKGLGFNAQLPDTSYARDLAVSVERGDITQNSFGFETLKDDWNDKGTERDLVEVKLWDVSPVTFPAYPQTQVKLRGAFEAIGVDYERLSSVIIRAERKLELNEEQVDLLRSTVKIFEGFLPHTDEPPAEGHSEDLAEPDYSTLIRMDVASRTVKNILEVH